MSHIVRFEKIVPEGKALGHLKDGRAVFAIGPLPGELARISLRKQKRTYAEASLREIVEPSPQRTQVAEDHCLSCSPWQSVDYSYQLELKQDMLIEAFRQHHLDVPIEPCMPAPNHLHYRNRLDFSVVPDNDRLQLAFHVRGAWDNYVALPDGCQLGSDIMNDAALNLIFQLNERGLAPMPSTITVRHARSTEQLLTILTTTANADWSHIQSEKLGNFAVARPLPGSGAPGPLIYNRDEPAITEHITGIDISYPYDAFFQANTAVFEKSLEDITRWVQGSPTIVELYSGVGAIGLPLAARGAAVHGIETVSSAVEYAKRNAKANNLPRYSAEVVAAEQMSASILKTADTVIVDPPRAGLHPNVISWLLEAHPGQIIYLSCNPVTQARDLAALSPAYACKSVRGYDFYPGTLHIESLAILG